MDGVSTVLDYVKSLSLAPGERRLLESARLEPDDVQVGVESARSDSPMARMRRVGAILNKSTQYLYINGRAKVAMELIEDGERRLVNYSAQLEASIFQIELQMNKIRLCRALGSSSLCTQILKLQDEASSVVARVTSEEQARAIKAAVQHICWVEPFKCEWRKRNFEECLVIALGAPRPNQLADECVLRSRLELCDYLTILKFPMTDLVVASWSLTYAAAALCRASAQKEFEALENALFRLSPLAKIRIVCESTSANRKLRLNLARKAFVEASEQGNQPSALLAAAVLVSMNDRGENCLNYGAAAQLFRSSRHNVVRFVSAASCTGSWLRLAASRASAELVQVIDTELVQDLVAYQVSCDGRTGYPHDKTRSGMNWSGSFTEALGKDAVDDSLRIEIRCRSALDQL